MAQTTFSYTYDNAGNRTNRALVMQKMGTVDTTIVETGGTGDENINPDENLHDNIGDVSLTLYPNPTKGLIEIKAENIDADITCEILVYDPKGVLLIKQPWSNGESKVNLTRYPQGTYFVKFVANGEVSDWKVIKE